MTKVRINGEYFDWDPARKPMSEALALEATLKCTYAQWETDLQAGSARAMCGFIWLVWRRAGRDVKLADILSGDTDIDLNDLTVEPDEGETDEEPPPDPTGTPPTGDSPPTGAATSPRSAKSA